MIRALLIANRGEIAVRIVRTASEMGIRCVGLYTAEERDAPHVLVADEAVLLEGTGAAAYLDARAVIEAARRSGAEAVHPGYGFLAENAAFARAVTDAGLIWVGPPAEAIARMGDKLEAKRVARTAGVPVLEPMQTTSVRFPALIKSVAGGGGKGMRVVRSPDELEAALAASSREAQRAFGDGTVFIEPFLEGSRHVEIQVLGDGHGNLVHLFERECSIQRRHQKVVEEAPSPVVGAELRERLGEAALALARAIGYRNAGTVEFLLGEDERFFFLEMNTRLQVEHPVTEEITDVDLVRQQFLDAAGYPIEVVQDELDIEGHAIEVRLNAEDAAHDFLPATGTLTAWRPARDLPVRYEEGVQEGSVIGTSFDPLLAKVIAHAPTRTEAAELLARALEATSIQGVRTNRDLLVAILRDFEFLNGRTTTDFLERVRLEPIRRLAPSERAAALVAAALNASEQDRQLSRVLTTLPAGWRNSRMPPERRTFVLEGGEVTVSYRRDRQGRVVVDWGEGEVEARLGGRPEDLDRAVEVGGRTTIVSVDRIGDRSWVHGPWGDVELVERSPFPTATLEEVSGSLVAPMPGRVVSVEVAVGERVGKGQTLVVLEAMKMEHSIESPEDGVVRSVNVRPDEQVERGALLAVVEAVEGGGVGKDKAPTARGGPEA